jgi:hypothetical protein
MLVVAGENWSRNSCDCADAIEPSRNKRPASAFLPTSILASLRHRLMGASFEISC